MIYRITGEFSTDNFNMFINKINKNFKFIYKNNNLYISLINYEFSLNKNLEKYLKNIFKPNKDFLIKEIDENNLSKYDQDIIDWCRDNFVELDKQKYQLEQQEKLKATMKALDIIEEKLNEERKNRIREKDFDKNNERKEGDKVG